MDRFTQCATFDPEQLISQLRPRALTLHDVDPLACSLLLLELLDVLLVTLPSLTMLLLWVLLVLLVLLVEETTLVLLLPVL